MDLLHYKILRENIEDETMTKNKDKDTDKSKESSAEQGKQNLDKGLTIPRQEREFTLPSGRDVTVLELTGVEEGKLRNLRKLRDGMVLEEVFTSCVKGISGQDEILAMYRGDRAALMAFIRVTSYGDDYRFKISCPRCQGINHKQINLTDLPLKPAIENAPTEITLPRSGWTVTLRPLTGNDEHKILRQAKDDEDSRRSYELYLAVETINGKPRDTVTDLEAFTNLPGLDNMAIRSALRDLEPGLDTSVECICSHCQNEWVPDVPFDEGFFYPEEAQARS